MPDIAISYAFRRASVKETEPDIEIQCNVRVKYIGEMKPSPAVAPTVIVRRYRGSRVTGRIHLLEPGRDGEPNEGTVTKEPDQGIAKRTMIGRATPTATGYQWEFFIRAQPGGNYVSFRFHSHMPGEPEPNAWDPPTQQTKPMGTERIYFDPDVDPATPTVAKLKPRPFPRLVVGLNEATGQQPGTTMTPETGLAKDIKPTLDHVVARLRGDLGEAWEGGKPTTVSTTPASMSTAPWQTANHEWANQVAEMLTLSPYGGPGPLYAYNESDIVAQGLYSTEPHYYHIASACQQLCSFALASRGFTFKDTGYYKVLLNAGITCTKTWADSSHIDGKWVTADSSGPVIVPDDDLGDPHKINPDPKLREAPFLFLVHEVDSEVEFSPGAVFLYSNRKTGLGSKPFIYKGKEYVLSADARKQDVWGVREDEQHLRDNTAGAHIGFTLRTNPTAGNFQLLDTGACMVPEWGEGVEALPRARNFHSGIFDGPGTTGVGAGKDPFRGLGVLKKPSDERSAGTKLKKHVDDVLKKAMPLGLVRMVLVHRGSRITIKNAWRFRDEDWLIYASPIRPMWESGDEQNYSISRYLWALRDFPSCEKVQPYWFFYVPRKELAQVMMESGARGRSVQELVKEAIGRMKLAARNRYYKIPDVGARTARALGDLTFPVTDGTTTAAGKVQVTATYRRYPSMHPLHSLEGRWGVKARLPLNQHYLQASQSDGAFDSYYRW